MFRQRIFLITTVILATFQGLSVAATPENRLSLVPCTLTAASRQQRVDLHWQETPAARFEIQRAASPEGPFETLSTPYPNRSFFTDFTGQTGTEFCYRVRALSTFKKGESGWSSIVHAKPLASQPDALLNDVQEAAIHYFYDYGHPASGLARESFLRNPELCATGATGMGLFNLIVGVERGFMSRAEGAARTLKILDFYATKAERYHGAFAHWLNGETGKTIPFSTFDDGADLVETSFLVEGVLASREYFSGALQDEARIRTRADELWRGVEWDWFAQQGPSGTHLQWHWSPTHGWKQALQINGFNEAQAAYLLALASPTHSIKPQCYYEGWVGPACPAPHDELGVKMELSQGLGPSLFFTHYSYLGFDPHAINYGSKSYFEHFKDLCKVQINYAASKRGEFDGLWGITASYGPDGYRAFAPGKQDNGTLAPTAALSSMPYAPQAAQAFLADLYQKHGKELWGPFGFSDAFNLKRKWASNDYIGIDVGPIAPMIENYRSGLCWKLFMKAKEIGPLLKLLSEPRAENRSALTSSPAK